MRWPPLARAPWLLLLSGALCACASGRSTSRGPTGAGSTSEVVLGYVPEKAWFRPVFDTEDGDLEAGSAFVAEIAPGDYVVATAFHLLGKAGGLSRDYRWNEVTGRVRGLSGRPGGHRVRTTRPLTLNGAISLDKTDHPSRDLALFPLSGDARTHVLKLGENAKAGDRVWLVAEVVNRNANQRRHVARVVESSPSGLVYVFDDAGLDLRATSGAPIVNASNEVVGVNLGGGKQDGQTLGLAAPVSGVRYAYERRRVYDPEHNPGEAAPTTAPSCMPVWPSDDALAQAFAHEVSDVPEGGTVVARLQPGRAPHRPLRLRPAPGSEFVVWTTRALSVVAPAAGKSTRAGTSTAKVRVRVQSVEDGRITAAVDVDETMKVTLPIAKKTPGTTTYSGSFVLTTDGRFESLEVGRAPKVPEMRTVALRAQMREYVLPFPREPVGVGGVWSILRRIPQGKTTVVQHQVVELVAWDGDSIELRSRFVAGEGPALMGESKQRIDLGAPFPTRRETEQRVAGTHPKGGGFCLVVEENSLAK